jgi:hypothetical protein
VRLEIAECLIGLGKLDEAARAAEDALEVLTAANVTEAELGPARFSLARTLPDRDRERARELANRALHAVDRDGALAAKIRTWLARR